MAMLTRVVRYAYEKGRRPSEIWEEVQLYPRDYVLLFEYQTFHDAEEAKAAQAASK